MLQHADTGHKWTPAASRMQAVSGHRMQDAGCRTQDTSRQDVSGCLLQSDASRCNQVVCPHITRLKSTEEMNFAHALVGELVFHITPWCTSPSF